MDRLHWPHSGQEPFFGLVNDHLSHRRRPGELLRMVHRTAPAHSCCRHGGKVLLANAARPRLASLMQSACPQHKIVTSPAVTVNGIGASIKFETLYRSGDTYGTLRRHVCPRVRWLVRHLAWIVFVVVRGGWVAGSSASHDATAS